MLNVLSSVEWCVDTPIERGDGAVRYEQCTPSEDHDSRPEISRPDKRVGLEKSALIDPEACTPRTHIIGVSEEATPTPLPQRVLGIHISPYTNYDFASKIFGSRIICSAEGLMDTIVGFLVCNTLRHFYYCRLPTRRRGRYEAKQLAKLVLLPKQAIIEAIRSPWAPIFVLQT